MNRIGALVVAAGAGSLLLAACGSDETDSTGLTIVASAYPFAFAAERVAGDEATVDNLTSPGVEPHDIELAPQQLAQVTDAALVVYEEGFQPAVDDAVAQSGLDSIALVDVAELVPLATDGAVEPDPHVWLDPQHMVSISQAVADRLVEIDPDHAAAYRDSAGALHDELMALDRAFLRGLASCERRTVVTSHDAFGYLATSYDLDIVPIAGLDPTLEPTPDQQAEIADLVEARGVTTIFTEELVSTAVAESIADEAGAQTAVLDPIEGLGDDTSSEDYLSLMRANLAALEQANGCT